MTDNEPQSADEQEAKKPLGLKRPGRLDLKKTVESGQVRQSFSHGRTKTVQVEKKKNRTLRSGPDGSKPQYTAADWRAPGAAPAQKKLKEPKNGRPGKPRRDLHGGNLGDTWAPCLFAFLEKMRQVISEKK